MYLTRSAAKQGGCILHDHWHCTPAPPTRPQYWRCVGHATEHLNTVSPLKIGILILKVSPLKIVMDIRHTLQWEMCRDEDESCYVVVVLRCVGIRSEEWAEQETDIWFIVVDNYNRYNRYNTLLHTRSEERMPPSNPANKGSIPFHHPCNLSQKKHWHQISPQSTVGAIPMLTIPRHIRSWMEQAAAPLHDTIPSPITPTGTSGHAHGSIRGCGGGTADILIGLLWSCSLSPHPTSGAGFRRVVALNIHEDMYI